MQAIKLAFNYIRKSAMKKITVLSMTCLVVVMHLSATAFARPYSSGSGGSHNVSGHITKDGTYVAPHQQTNPNGTQRDNWSSKPNVNPYTGQTGTKEPQR